MAIARTSRFSPTERLLFWVLISLATGLMIGGHALIYGQSMKDGLSFDILHTYVSRYAAKHPEGWWIKSAILAAIGVLTWVGVAFSKKLEKEDYWKSLFVLISMALMAIGLLLVASCNILSPHETPQPAIVRKHHFWGFFLLVTGFVFGTSFSAWWRFPDSKQRSPFDLLLVILTVASVIWLVVFQDSFPGLPQRFLLFLVGCWAVRSALYLRLDPDRRIMIAALIVCILPICAGFTLRPPVVKPLRYESLNELAKDIQKAVRSDKGDIRWVAKQFTPQGRRCWMWLNKEEFFIRKKDFKAIEESSDGNLLYLQFIEPNPSEPGKNYLEHIVLIGRRENGNLLIDDIFLDTMKDDVHNERLSWIVDYPDEMGERLRRQRTEGVPPPPIPEEIREVYSTDP